jgi:hypothetical protein
MTFLSNSFNEFPERECYDIGYFKLCQTFF